MLEVRMTTAKVYDFDPSYHCADGEDEKGEYVVRGVDCYALDGSIILRTGERSHAYKIADGSAREPGD